MKKAQKTEEALKPSIWEDKSLSGDKEAREEGVAEVSGGEKNVRIGFHDQMEKYSMTLARVIACLHTGVKNITKPFNSAS